MSLYFSAEKNTSVIILTITIYPTSQLNWVNFNLHCINCKIQTDTFFSPFNKPFFSYLLNGNSFFFFDDKEIPDRIREELREELQMRIDRWKNPVNQKSSKKLIDLCRFLDHQIQGFKNDLWLKNIRLDWWNQNWTNLTLIKLIIWNSQKFFCDLVM